MAEFDILIKNVKVIDGTGNPWYKSDVGIADGKIDYIGSIKDAEAATVIDGQDFVLSPGFIDEHAHSDLYMFNDSSIYPKIAQGITTDVSGNCGISCAPVSNEHFEYLKKYMSGLGAGINPPENWKDFTTFENYLNEINKLKLGPNVAFYVGQGTIRIAVMGFENRRATKEEMRRMKDLVREAMESGAVGMSTGLIYPPGVYTPKDELVELCKVVAEYGGVYASHIRNESYDVLNAVSEAIDIGRQAGTPVIISHHKVAGKRNWGKSVETLELIDRANREGIEVSLDQYPYKAGSSLLSASIPPQYHVGGVQKLIENLKDRENWESIKKDIMDDSSKWENFVLHCGMDGILVLSAKQTPEAEGKSIKEYADEKGVDSFETLFTVLVENEGAALAAYFMADDEDIERIMGHPYTIIATDGILAGPGVKAHPRCTGTFPRVLGRYVREKKVLRLEEAIRKMTSLPALKLGLKTKGLIKEGMDADLVIFDPNTIIDRADYLNHDGTNLGIKYVIVNGRVALKDNQYTGTAAGKVVRADR